MSARSVVEVVDERGQQRRRLTGGRLRVREALRAANDEIAQLKAAVGALRESLEKAKK